MLPGCKGLCLSELTEVSFQALHVDGMDGRNNWWIFMGEGGGGWQVEASGHAWVLLVDDYDLCLNLLFCFFSGMLEV